MHRRSLAPALVLPCLAAVVALALALPASAQVEELEIDGIFSLTYARSFQDTELGGRDFDDGNGLDARAGFRPLEWLEFDLGFQLQVESDYQTYFFPVDVRVFAPLPLDNVRLYGQGGLGPFFSQLSGKFSSRDNERGSAWRLGGGVEVGLTEDWAAVLDAAYTRGLGSTDDYRSTTVGVGVVYRWEL